MNFNRFGQILLSGIRVAIQTLAQFSAVDCGAICILGGLGLGALLGFTLMQILEPRPVPTADEFSLLEFHCGQGMDLRDLGDFMSLYGGAVAGLFGGGWLGENLPAMFQTGLENSLCEEKFKIS